jgi:hypothetical protein
MNRVIVNTGLIAGFAQINDERRVGVAQRLSARFFHTAQANRRVAPRCLERVVEKLSGTRLCDVLPYKW